jgi:hypothetical protein
MRMDEQHRNEARKREPDHDEAQDVVPVHLTFVP